MAAVTDKQLIPAKFGLGDSPVKLADLKKKIASGVNALKISPAAKEFCMHLLEHSAKGATDIPKFPTRLSEKEINIILKDFGELTGAVYILSRCKLYSSVKFPSGNEQLIDYIMIRKDDGLEEKVSAKAGVGSKPSISALMPAIDIMEKKSGLSDKMKKAIKVIKLISTEEKNGLYLGPLKAAKFLKTPGYIALIKLLKDSESYVSGNDVPNSDELEAAVHHWGSFKGVMEGCKPFFDAAGYTVNQTVTKRLIETPRAGKEKVWGVLHYPITAELIRWLNDPKNGAKEVLMRAATTLTVNQIYMKTDSKKYYYQVVSFSKANFEFGSPSSMPRPTNNRIGFKMTNTKMPKAGLPDH